MSFARYLFIFFFLLSGFTSFSQSIKGNYAIKNIATGLLLRPLEASNKNATPIVGYTPTNWKCMTWHFISVTGETYSLKNLLTGKTFQPEVAIADGAKLSQQPLATGNEAQQWEFIPAKEQGYLIRLKGSDYYITAVNDNINSNIILAKKKGDKSQYWTIYQQDPTY